MSCYKLKLFRYRKERGYEEELVVANFNPAKVDGFAILRNIVRRPVAKKR